MVDIANRISEALGLGPGAVAASGDGSDIVGGLPLLAASSFGLQRVNLFGEGVVVARAREKMPPTTLVRLLAEVSAATGETVVLSVPSLTPYMRRTLLRSGQGFVTDDGQAFVPGMMRLLPERRVRDAAVSSGTWGPSAREAFLFLLGHLGEEVTAADLVGKTGMSATSAKRALVEVAGAVPVERSVGGPTARTAIWRVVSPDEFVERGTVAFGEAVTRRAHVMRDGTDALPLAGLSALATRSLIAPPRVEQRACQPRDLRGLQRANPYGDGGDVVELLVLSYDPMPFAEGGVVDVYTMVRTVDRSDERVDASVEEATEGCPWLRLA